jgi:hypothetical protein
MVENVQKSVKCETVAVDVLPTAHKTVLIRIIVLRKNRSRSHPRCCRSCSPRRRRRRRNRVYTTLERSLDGHPADTRQIGRSTIIECYLQRFNYVKRPARTVYLRSVRRPRRMPGAADCRTAGVGCRFADRRLIGNNAHHIAGPSPRVTTAAAAATTTTTKTLATAKPTSPCPVRRFQRHCRRRPCGPSRPNGAPPFWQSAMRGPTDSRFAPRSCIAGRRQLSGPVSALHGVSAVSVDTPGNRRATYRRSVRRRHRRWRSSERLAEGLGESCRWVNKQKATATRSALVAARTSSPAGGVSAMRYQAPSTLTTSYAWSVEIIHFYR